jgi:thioredoxin:protein disulfide reductase
MRVLLFLSVFLTTLTSWAQTVEDDLLEPEKAFRLSARMADADTLEASWKIVDGYYLYRSKFRFKTETPDVTLGAPEFPKGKIKDDEFFGKMEIYRNEAIIRIPVTYSGPAKPFTLQTVSQGCADIGVCFPPLSQTVDVLPITPLQQPAAALSGLRDLARQLVGENLFLPPDEAFRLKLEAVDATTIMGRFNVAHEYYLYQDKIKFQTLTSRTKISGVELPKPETKQDPNFGTTKVYHNGLEARLTLERQTGSGNRIEVEAQYQGCSEKGVCYPPIIKTYALTLPPMPEATAASVQEPPVSAPVEKESGAVPTAEPEPSGTAGPSSTATPVPQASAPPADSESDSAKIAAILKGGGFWAVLASFLGFGLLLSFTPCVFPMIPILSGIIVGQKERVTKSKGFFLSVAYVLGMALTYAGAGVVAALSGTLISNALQNPWALGVGAAIFVALAFSMFGFYELQLPSALQSRFTEASNRLKGGNLIGVFAMGAISALIIGPCVAPPLAGALAYIAQTNNTVLGFWALFSLAIGMGVPLLLVGLSAGALLPKAGAWMDAVKNFFGVAMLGVAIWLTSPLMPDVLQMTLWAALLIGGSMYLHALDPLPPHASGWKRLWKGAGVIALLAGAALLIGALGGSRDILQPLAIYQAGAAAPAGVKSAHGLQFERVKTVNELRALVLAVGRPVMLDFYADWCVSCKEMERFTFSDPRVQARLNNVLLLQADVTANSKADKALLQHFSLFGPPGIIFYDAAGSESSFRVVGYEPPEKFLESLDKALP